MSTFTGDFTSLKDTDHLALNDGSRVGIIGAGPAGSFFGYFLAEMAERVGLSLAIDAYEARDFSKPAPQGCNMCGGIISESLVQNLATEGILLPANILQRGIDSYMLHTDGGSVRIETPLKERRIGAVYRGSGPRDAKDFEWGSFDLHLQRLAEKRGVRVIPKRVEKLEWHEGKPVLSARGDPPREYDLLAVAVGVNSPTLKLFQTPESTYEPPQTTKTLIREFYLGRNRVDEILGNAMHVFLLDIPSLEFAAIIPKGDYVSVCLLGESIDKSLVERFLDSPEVKRCLPPDARPAFPSCQCAPRINIQGARKPFGDRLVFLGDCGVTRLYKDGIGAAYRTAKAAATTAVLQGISEEAFRTHYWPLCSSILFDNRLGKLTFLVTRFIQRNRPARKAIIRQAAAEQAREGNRRHMSIMLWDMFTGSSPYRDILQRGLRPDLLGPLAYRYAASVLPRPKQRKERQ